jgi:hypothetical protein
MYDMQFDNKGVQVLCVFGSKFSEHQEKIKNMKEFEIKDSINREIVDHKKNFSQVLFFLGQRGINFKIIYFGTNCDNSFT